MRIHSLRVQNVLAVENVELQPKGAGITVIAGKNGQGKSSLLRAVELLLEYRVASRKVDNPLRNGQDKGTVEMDLGDGLIVRRTITEKSTTLTVKRGDEEPGAPQSFLDTIRPPDLLDPLAFSAMSPAERRALMIRVAGLGDELAAAEADVALEEDVRLQRGREARAALASADELPNAPEGTPDSEIDVGDLLAQLQVLQTQYREQKAAEVVVEKAQDARQRAAAKVEAAKKALADAKAEEKAAVATYQRAVDARSACPEPSESEAAALQEAIAGASETNKAVQRKLLKATARDKSRIAREKHEAAEKSVESARAARDTLIDQAELPLPGLGFDDEDATFNGVRWASLGTAEQLRIGLSLGAAQHPGLPVFVIHRGESLDAEALAAVDAWAQEQGVQILMEVVGGEGHEGAFVIEAGRLK